MQLLRGLELATVFTPDEPIDPRDTRRMLCEFAAMAAPLRMPGPTVFGPRP